MGANLRIILPSEASIKAAWWKLALRLPPEGRWESRYGARRCWGEAAVHGSIWRGRPGIRPGSELKVTRNLLGTASCDGRAHARQGWHSAAHGPAVRTVAKPGARPFFADAHRTQLLFVPVYPLSAHVADSGFVLGRSSDVSKQWGPHGSPSHKPPDPGRITACWPAQCRRRCRTAPPWHG
jgi:hypothetical protein